MKVERIVSLMEQYGALKARLHRDMLDYETYKTLEPDEEKEKITLQKIMYDYEEIGKFLDIEI